MPLWPRIRQATGTVYGDIGTSVLYTIMEITREAVLLRNHHLGHAAAASLVASGGDLLSKNDLLGELSLVFWALIFLTAKYDLMIMRADHRGEGGTFALWSLLKGYSGRIFAGFSLEDWSDSWWFVQQHFLLLTESSHHQSACWELLNRWASLTRYL
ncbi:MAG: KUP/HAK/KT family potassium transporter [Planctomycetota bacterium]|nr:KUP/HAK/KT family potassium transporter [Planctomycetota bacterium]